MWSFRSISRGILDMLSRRPYVYLRQACNYGSLVKHMCFPKTERYLLCRTFHAKAMCFPNKTNKDKCSPRSSGFILCWLSRRVYTYIFGFGRKTHMFCHRHAGKVVPIVGSCSSCLRLLAVFHWNMVNWQQYSVVQHDSYACVSADVSLLFVSQ